MFRESGVQVTGLADIQSIRFKTFKNINRVHFVFIQLSSYGPGPDESGLLLYPASR